MTWSDGPLPGTRRGAGSVSGPARQVHLAALMAFAATGQPPSPAEIERLIRAGGGEPDRVRAELTAADMLNFFTSARTARSWASRQPEIAGTILGRDGPLRIGIDQFGALLQPADNPAAAPERSGDRQEDGHDWQSA